MQDKLNAQSLPHIAKQLKTLCDTGKSFKIVVKDWSKRGLSANAQAHVWHKYISEWTGDDLKTVECMNKRDFGLPIILADDEHGPKVSYMLDKCGYWQMSHYQQLGLIEYLPITSLFSSKQHTEYRDNMQAGYRERGIELHYLD